MRILMLSQFYSPVVGGQERAVENLSRALARRGHRVSVVTLAVDDDAGRSEEGGVLIHRVRGAFQRATPLFREPARPHVPPVADVGVLLELRRVITRESPDVVHAHDWLVRSVVPIVRRRPMPLVMSLHDHSLVCANKRLMRGEVPCSGPRLDKCMSCAFHQYGAVKGPPIVLAVRRLVPGVSSTVSRFLPVSDSVARLSGLDRSGLPYEVLPNFVPQAILAPPPPDADRPELPVCDSEYVVFAGDATRDKGADVLLRAHSQIGGKPSLVFIGRPVLPELRNPPLSVTTSGPQPHDVVIEALRRSMFAVVPSVCQEAFGLSALEAMAVGRPVIASRSGGLADLVVPGQTGLLTPPGDVDALAEAMVLLRDHAELRERMGSLARRRAENFGEDPIVERVERVYEEVAAGAQGRSR